MGSATAQDGTPSTAALAKSVRPFVQRNKTDTADAQAIWTAGQQPGARFVAVKTLGQQVVLSLHRLRAQLMKMRIMQTNELRGLLYEFGIVLPEGHRALLKELPAALALASQQLPSMLVESLHEQVSRRSTPTSLPSNGAWHSNCATRPRARRSPTSPALA
jgi:transposase